jgi:hypothetical protein
MWHSTKCHISPLFDLPSANGLELMGSRLLLNCLLSLFTTTAFADFPIDDWQDVKNLIEGAEISVAGPSSKVNCILLSATDDTLM